AALENDTVRAAMLTPPDTVWAERAGFLPFADARAYAPDYPSTQLIVATRLVRQRPAVVQRLVDAVIEGIAYAKHERAATQQILSTYLQTDDDAALDAVYEQFVVRLAAQAPFPSPGGVRRLLPVLAEIDSRVASLDPDTLVDRSFVQAAV